MRVLFVTRKYPPSSGGMENAAFELHRAMTHVADVRLIKWGGSNKFLPVVYPWLLLRAIVASWTFKPDVIYLQDGLMAPLGSAVKWVSRKPTVLTIHGLEVTHQGGLYRRLVLPWMRRQTAVVVISEETKRAVGSALPGTNVHIVHNGVRDVFQARVSEQESSDVIGRSIGLDPSIIAKSWILYTNGRLVKRKGGAWFVNHVMPKLVERSDRPLLYLISGTGPEHEEIERAITRHHLKDSVKLLGWISDELRDLLYSSADMFIMPNIPVPNDMEGFGLVALEAASCGTLVVASDLEGLSDAIQDHKNGVLVKPESTGAYVDTIVGALRKRPLKSEAIRAYTLEHYSWEAAARDYTALMQELMSA